MENKNSLRIEFSTFGVDYCHHGFGIDNISGLVLSIISGALTPNVNSIHNFRERLRTLSLNATPNNATDLDRFVDVYNVFK